MEKDKTDQALEVPCLVVKKRKYCLQAETTIDSEKVSEQKAYRLRLSRWFQGCFSAVKNPLFWFLVTVCKALRAPLHHWYLFLQRASQNHNEGRALFTLVVSKIEELQKEYHMILCNLNGIISQALEMSGCNSSLSGNDIEKLRALSWKLAMQQWSSLQRRLATPLQQQPVKQSNLSISALL